MIHDVAQIVASLIDGAGVTFIIAGVLGITRTIIGDLRGRDVGADVPVRASIASGLGTGALFLGHAIGAYK